MQCRHLLQTASSVIERCWRAELVVGNDIIQPLQEIPVLTSNGRQIFGHGLILVQVGKGISNISWTGGDRRGKMTSQNSIKLPLRNGRNELSALLGSPCIVQSSQNGSSQNPFFNGVKARIVAVASVQPKW